MELLQLSQKHQRNSGNTLSDTKLDPMATAVETEVVIEIAEEMEVVIGEVRRSVIRLKETRGVRTVVLAALLDSLGVG